MLLLKYLLLSAGIAMFVIAAGILTYDAYLLIAHQRRRLHADPAAGSPGPAPAMRWRTSVALVMLAAGVPRKKAIEALKRSSGNVREAIAIGAQKA